MQYIHAVNLAAMDLNLLVAFDALIAEASVTRAAKRVGLSQPAMSNALARLRTVLRDPLFVRSPRGMLATPRARELAAPVRDALASLQRALTPVRFDPRTTTRAFTIATVDSTELVLGAPLLERVSAEAPGVRLAIIPPARGADPTELLESERADLAIISTKPVQPPLRAAPLWESRFVCIARRKHPIIRARLSLAQFTAARHVLIAPYGAPGSYIDDRLAEMRRSRAVVMRTSTFAAAPFIVADTDCIAVVPQLIADHYASTLGLQVLTLPFDMPAVSIGQVWHPRMEHDDAHRWFRELVSDVAARVRGFARVRA
jgi:DNA-binding transcriptional LysR family regulator